MERSAVADANARESAMGSAEAGFSVRRRWALGADLRIRLMWMTALLSGGISLFGVMRYLGWAGGSPPGSMDQQQALLGLIGGGATFTILFAVAALLNDRGRSLWLPRIVCLLLCVGTALGIPEYAFENAVPQAVWIPIIVTALLCDLRCLGVVVALESLILMYRLDLAEGIERPLTLTLTVALLVMVFLFRWLNDRRVEELRTAHERALFLSLHDPLTELPNRRCFHQRLNATAASSDREASSFALMLVDVDHFATVNNRFGHDVGDQILLDLSQVLRRSVRATDTVARLGGDEFAVMLPNVPSAQVGERIAQHLCESVRTIEGQASPTVSVGLALFPTHGRTVEEVLKRADQALYAAKEAGRDTYRSWDESMAGSFTPATLAVSSQQKLFA